MLTRVMPAHCKGGMQDHVMLISKLLSRKGCEVTVLTTQHPMGKMHEEVDGVKIHYIGNTIPGSYFGGWWQESINKFTELNSIEPFDIVHSQSAGAYYLIKKEINIKHNIPVVVSLHGTAYDEIKTRYNIALTSKNLVDIIKPMLFILKHIYYYFIYDLIFIRGANAIIATSNEQERIIEKTYFIEKDRIFKVFNGIDPELFVYKKNESIRNRYKLLFDTNFILSIARLEKDKGIQNIIAVLPNILKELPNTRLMIIGDGSYAPELKKQVKRLNLENNVIFTGMLPFESLPDYFNACDLFVNPTIRQNGYDLTILEAMACEKPVVVSNIGSVPTVIEDGVDGLLVPTGDIKKLAEAVIKVLTDKELAQRLGKAARKKILEKFSIESMVEGTIKVYEEVIRRNKEKQNQK